MADIYYGNAQFQTMLEQRTHKDKFVSEVILTGSALDVDFADFIVGDIFTGNTKTLRRHFKSFKRWQDDYSPTIYDGVSNVPGAPYHGVITDHTFYGVVPLKDDYSNTLGAAGYYDLPETDARRKLTIDILDTLNMDALDISEKILAPEPIGAVGSSEFHDYQKQWDDSPSLQAEYGTVESWRNTLVSDRSDQVSGMVDVTDVYVGLYATGGSLAESNVIALYRTMEHIYPQVTFNGLSYSSPNDDLPPLSYMYQYSSGFFLVTNGWHGWSHIIRYGIVENEFDLGGVVKWRKAKPAFRIVTNAASANIDMTDGDPIYQILVENQLELNGWIVNGGSAGTGMLEVQVQLPSLPDGTHIYGEIRVWDYTSLHTNIANNGTDIINLKAGIGGGLMPPEGSIEITSPDSVTVPDGSVDIMTITTDDINAIVGFSADALNTDSAAFTIDPNTGVMTANAPLDYATQNVYYVQIVAENTTMNTVGYQYLTINVENTNSVPEPPVHKNPFADKLSKGPDLVFFPLEYKAVRKIPIFRRERFLRESTMVALYTIQEVNLKWYQKTWFKVVLFVIAVVISVFFSPAAGEAGWEAFTASNIITAAVQIAFTQIIIQGVLKTIDNPYIAFIVQVAALLVAGKFAGTINLQNISLADAASIGMEATGTAIKKYYAQQIKKMKKEYEEFAKEMDKYEKQIDDFIESNNLQMRSDASDWVDFVSSTAVVESTENTMARTLDINNAIIEDVDDMVDVTKLLDLYR